MKEIVVERERGGGFDTVADLAARCATRRDALERLAWAGACDTLACGSDELTAGTAEHGADRSLTARRRALWLLGASTPGMAIPAGTQLALPLEPAEPPELPALSPWERMLADYGSTSVTLREHPLGLMRPSLGEEISSSADLERLASGAQVTVAGLVVARQRPATARGVTFMLLEDEHGTINLIVSPPVFERCRTAVRTEPLVLADGRLERHEGTTNVVVSAVRRLDRPDLPLGEVRHIEPGRAWSNDELRDGAGAREPRAPVDLPAATGTDDLRAVAPTPHSFGRRGR